MKNKIKYIILLTTCLFGLNSCTNFLEVTPISVANVNQFYKTGQDATLATNACYSNLQGLGRNELWLFGETMSDNSDDPDATIDNFSLDANNQGVENFWRQLYSGISRCNTASDRIPDITMDESLKQRLLLECRFLRAFYYFQLVQYYGDVPLILKEVTSLNDNLAERVPSAKVYEQIIKDLTAAEALPVSYASADVGRATRGAAKMLLAKVYLAQRNWTAAATKSKEIIDAGTYSLLQNYSDLFTVASNNSIESVFEIQFSIGAQAGTGSFLGQSLFEVFAPAGSGAIVTGVAASNGQGRNVPTKNLIDAYEKNDPRLASSIATSYVRPPNEIISVNYNLKSLDPTASAGGLGSGSRENLRVYRYADLLLMYSEALNEIGGNNPEAFKAINSVRTRARGRQPDTVLPNLTAISQVQFRAAVALERRVELAFENHRWTDLIRTGEALNIMTGIKQNFKARNLLLPIPQRELIVNSLLTQNKDF